jgi:hypothetical protein
LEGSGNITKPKGHDEVFKCAIVRSEGSLPFIAFSDVNEVIGSTEVEFGKGLGGMEMVDEIRNVRKWVSVFLSDAVKTSIVYAQAQATIFLLNK